MDLNNIFEILWPLHTCARSAVIPFKNFLSFLLAVNVKYFLKVIFSEIILKNAALANCCYFHLPGQKYKAIK